MIALFPGLSQSDGLSGRVLEVLENASRKLTAAQKAEVAQQIATVLVSKDEVTVERILREFQGVAQRFDGYTSDDSLSDPHVRLLAQGYHDVLEQNLSIPPLSPADQQAQANQLTLLKQNVVNLVNGAVTASMSEEARSSISARLISRIDRASSSYFDPRFKYPMPPGDFDGMIADLFKSPALAIPLVIDSKEKAQDANVLRNTTSLPSGTLTRLTTQAYPGHESEKFKALSAAFQKEHEQLSATRHEESDEEWFARAEARMNREFEEHLKAIQGRLAARKAPDPTSGPAPTAATIPEDAPSRPTPEFRPSSTHQTRTYATWLVLGALGLLLSGTLAIRFWKGRKTASKAS